MGDLDDEGPEIERPELTDERAGDRRGQEGLVTLQEPEIFDDRDKLIRRIIAKATNLPVHTLGYSNSVDGYVRSFLAKYISDVPELEIRSEYALALAGFYIYRTGRSERPDYGMLNTLKGD